MTATLRKPPLPHKQKAPVASKRRGRASGGVYGAVSGSRACVWWYMRVRRHQRRVAVGSPGAVVDGGVTDGLRVDVSRRGGVSGRRAASAVLYALHVQFVAD
jgi:hypothetical protein